VSRYQKGKTNLDFTEARDSEWQWHQPGHMQVCTSLQTNIHASTPPLSFYTPDALPAAQPTASKHFALATRNILHCLFTCRRSRPNGGRWAPLMHFLKSGVTFFFFYPSPVTAELSMGPFCVTRSNPTHQLTYPTRPNPLQLTNLTAWCNQILSNRALNSLNNPFKVLVLLL